MVSIPTHTGKEINDGTCKIVDMPITPEEVAKRRGQTANGLNHILLRGHSYRMNRDNGKPDAVAEID